GKEFRSAVASCNVGRHLAPGLLREQTNLTLAFRSDEAGHGSGLAETSVGKDCFPLSTLEQGRFLTKIGVGETPPTAGEPKHGLCPELRVCHVHEDEAAAWLHQFVEML